MSNEEPHPHSCGTPKGCKAKALEVLSCLSKELGFLGRQRFLQERCNFSGAQEEQYAARLHAADRMQLDILSNSFSAISCEEISSSVCHEFATFVKTIAIQLYDMFLLRVYDPLFPVQSDSPDTPSLESEYERVLQFQRELYQAELISLGSPCILPSLLLV